MQWYTNPHWWSVIATFLTGAIALIIATFGHQIKKLARKPKLIPELSLSPPDCHKIEMTDPKTGKLVENSYYFRVKIYNRGNEPAKNVEVKALELKKFFSKESKYKIDDKFLPINLVWSHTNGKEVNTSIISPDLFKHCDLFHTIKHNGKLFIMLDTYPVPNKVSSTRYPTILPPGKYKLKIAVAASNSKPQKKNVIIDFKGRWFEDQEEMFKESINVKISNN